MPPVTKKTAKPAKAAKTLKNVKGGLSEKELGKAAGGVVRRDT